MYKLDFFEEVESDLLALPQDVFEEANKYIKKYMEDPLKYSQKLFNKDDLNLEGYRKTYIANATYRIVIKVEDNITKIVEVVAVGKREHKEIYKEAYKRISINKSK